MAVLKSIPASNAPPPGLEAVEDLRPLKPLVAIPSWWDWFWPILILLSLAAAAYFFYRWRKRRQAAAPPAIPAEPPHVKAKRRIEAAINLISDPRQFCIEVSDALRQYLEERFALRAPERTTEEFLTDLRWTNLLNISQKNRLSEFLQECDLVKFAKFEPTESELRRLQESALRLVDETAFDAIAAPAAASTPALAAATASQNGGGQP